MTEELVAALHTALDMLLDVSWDRLADDEVLDAWRGLETVSRRLARSITR